MTRYTYSTNKTVRASKKDAEFWDIEKKRIVGHSRKAKLEFHPYGICWGAPKFYQCGILNAPTIRGLLDKIEGEG